MRWTDEHDVVLLREMFLFEPWNFKYASKERGQCWERISESLNQIQRPQFKVSQRSVQDRYGVLEKSYKKKNSEEERASGISPNETEADIALADIIERFEESSKEHKETSEKKKREQEVDAAKAEEMRARSLETYSETRKRNGSDDQSPTTSKRRNTGSETLKFLIEKSENEKFLKESEIEMRKRDFDLRKEELELKREESKNQMNFLSAQMELQKEEMRRNTNLMFQMQQQQQQFFLAMMEKFTKNN